VVRQATVPELGQVDRKKIAALVGAAPFPCDSGTRRGKRSVWGGRARGRSALSRATLVAVRHTPVLRAVSQWLRAAGMPTKVALTACLHTLLTILNALLRSRSRSRWSTDLAPSAS